MLLRYYSDNFALRKPRWSLPDYGGVQALLSAEFSGLVEVPAARGPLGSGCWTEGAGGTWKRMRPCFSWCSVEETSFS